MLPGMINLSGPVVGSGSLPIIVDFYSSASSQNIPIKNLMGYTKARVTVIRPGGYAYTGSTYDTGGGALYTSTYSGGGGNCYSSIITLPSVPDFIASFSNLNCWLESAGTILVGDTKGDVIYYGAPGGSGGYYSGAASGSTGNGPGGGAGGTNGNASGGIAGQCNIWTRTSDGATATAGNSGQDYGGGQQYATVGSGRGLVVIEWGVDKPF